MGLFSRLKELFNKNIECGSEIDDHIVYFFNKKKFIYLNKNIIVREHSACVVVYKGKMCDVILPGKYKINQAIIPETYSRAKIEKLNKNGAKVKRIRVDLYFVNTDEFKDFAYCSDEPFNVKSSELGRVKGYLQGNCVVRVLDAGQLVKCLIAETGRAKTDEIPKDIGLWIGNKINKKIQKDKIPTNMVLCNQSYVESILNTDLEDAFDKIGIFVKNIKLKAVDFPKKYQAKINDYMSKHKRVVKTHNLNIPAMGAENAVFINKNVSNQSSLNNTMQSLRNPVNINTFKTCPKCGHQNNINTNFCNNCGNKI